MRKILIDTNVYVAYKRNDPEIIKAFQNCDYIGVDVSVLAELYTGFLLGSRIEQNLKELEGFLNNSRVYIINHDLDTSEYYAHIYKNLRKNGTPVPTNDIWIASVARQHGLALLTKDKHFKLIDGLILY